MEDVRRHIARMMVAMLTAVLTVMLCGACAGEENQTATSDGGNTIVLGVEDVASPVTRAAQVPGSMNFNKLTETGFGVYGYKGTYNNASSTPTLFSTTTTNTRVTFISGGTAPSSVVDHPGSWTYAATLSDLKNWESGEKYTFFAYAPYMADNGTAPGITTIKATSDVAAGNPTIGYQVATDPTQSVDLLWGIRSDNGLPWKDIQRGQTAGAVMFTFYHALCAIGYHAQVIVDKDNNLTDAEDKSGIAAIGTDCKVTIKSITFEPNSANSKAGVFYQTGILNLNNSTAWTPNWGSLDGSIASLVLSDAQIDSKILDPAPADAAAVNAFLDDDTNHPGITQAANSQAVIAKDGSDKEQFYMLLPYEAKDYKLTVKYFITYKTGASTYSRSEELTGTAAFNDLELKAGVKYYFNMVFGLTTFKVSVLAYDWEGETIPTTVITENGTSASQSLARRKDLTE